MQSIIIPHRARGLHLGLCLWGLERSARACGVRDWEAVVVDDPVVNDPVFNKSRALNLGISRARGAVLTFLDVDALVGERFLECAAWLERESLDRVCYRVRKLPVGQDARVAAARDREADVADLFRRYADYPLAMEAYGRYDFSATRPPGPRGRARAAWDRAMSGGAPWGNSQFSIRRDRLGDLRYDEEIGWGTEDVDMNMRLQARFGAEYRGKIFTDAEHAMFHFDHQPSPWRERGFLSRAMRLHRRNRKKLLGY